MKYLQKLLHTGTRDIYSLDLNRSIYFTNLGCIILSILIGFDYIFTIAYKGRLFQSNNLMLFVLAAVVLSLNYKSKYNSSRLVFSFFLILLLARPFLYDTHSVAAYFEHSLTLGLGLFAPFNLLLNEKIKPLILFFFALEIVLQIYFFINISEYIGRDPIPYDVNLIPLTFLYLSISIVVSYYAFTSIYTVYQKKVVSMNKEVIASKSELNSVYKEIQLTNEKLENIVSNRTEILAAQNKSLTHHAFNNAHIIRAPLSSLMGIIHLLKSEKTKKKHREEILIMLNKSLNQLEIAVEKINEENKKGMLVD